MATLLERMNAERAGRREAARLDTRDRLRHALAELLPPGSEVWVFGSVLKPDRKMDAVGLEVLMRELAADCAVLAGAAANAIQWIGQPAPGRLEACAYEMNRFYTVLERSLERVCENFENHLEKSGSYHEKLLQRLALGRGGKRSGSYPDESIRSFS